MCFAGILFLQYNLFKNEKITPIKRVFRDTESSLFYMFYYGKKHSRLRIAYLCYSIHSQFISVVIRNILFMHHKYLFSIRNVTKLCQFQTN